MGNICSTPGDAKGQDDPCQRHIIQGASGHFGGITNDPDKTVSKPLQREPSYVPLQFTIAGAPQPQPSLPRYKEGTMYAQFCRHYREAAKQFPELRAVGDWHNHLVLDERHRATSRVKDCIRLLAWDLLALFQAYGASGTMACMNYANPEMGSFNEDEQAAASYLNDLYVLKTVVDVQKKLKETTIPTILKKGGLQERVEEIMLDTNIVAQQRHPRILAVIRDMKYNFVEYWDIHDLGLTRLLNVYADAHAADMEQKKVISNLSLNLIRAIQGQRKEQEDRKKDQTATVAKKKIIIITGVGISGYEFMAVKNELEKVEEGGSEFSIAVVHVVENPNEVSAHQQTLDNLNQGEGDIYEYVPIEAKKLLSNGPGSHILGKALCSHLPRVDRLRSKDKDLYGPEVLRLDENGQVPLPDKDDVQRELNFSLALDANTVGTVASSIGTDDRKCS